MNYAYQCSINLMIKFPQKAFLEKRPCLCSFASAIYCQAHTRTDLDGDRRRRTRPWMREQGLKITTFDLVIRKWTRGKVNAFATDPILTQKSPFWSLRFYLSFAQGFGFVLGRAPPNIQTISSDREHSCEGEQREKAQDEDWQVKWAQWNLKRKKEGKELTFFFFTDC